MGNRIAVATSQYFGIIGNGRQYILEILPNGQMTPVGAINPCLTFNTAVYKSE
jgi:hypothetical protein